MNLQNQVSYLPSMLDGVTLPSDDLDAELLKSVIMERCGLLEPLYSEPETMKEVISIWFLSHRWNIERLINLIKTSYSPLENYDRHESLNRSKNDSRNRSQNYSEDGTVITNDETERTVAAFNTSEYTPADKTVSDGKTTTETGGSTSGTEAGNEAETATNYIHGNVGVTTSQQMFLAELELLNGFNAYTFIVEKFAKDLMLSIW